MNNKEKYAEVKTPNILAELLIEKCLPHCHHISNIIEPGIGEGIFYKTFTKSCMIQNHNIKYTGIEINNEYTHILNAFKKENELFNFVIDDFLEYDLSPYKTKKKLFIGNLPFHNNGCVKTPSNDTLNKKNDGKTIWPNIVRKCMDVCNEGDVIAFIIPCIWLKPDRNKIYELFTRHKILYLHLFSCADSNKLFNYSGQTPTCIIILKYINEIETNDIPMCCGIDNIQKSEFIFKLEPHLCIPTSNPDLLLKSISFMKKYSIQSLRQNVKKIANMKQNVINGKIKELPENSILTYKKNKEHYYVLKSISTLNKDGEIYEMNGWIGTQPGEYDGVPKIILGHGRLPIPYLDEKGLYGIYGRDKYCIFSEKNDKKELELLYSFLSQPIIQKIILSFKIRMNFYELCIFDYVINPLLCNKQILDGYFNYIKNENKINMNNYI